LTVAPEMVESVVLGELVLDLCLLWITCHRNLPSAEGVVCW